MKKKYDLFWQGALTRNNADEVCKLLRKLLRRKKFVYVTSQAISNYEPQVNPNQRLKPIAIDQSIFVTHEVGSARISLQSTLTTNQWKTFLEDERVKEDMIISPRISPYFRFLGTAVLITQRDDNGFSHWSFTVQS